MIGSLLDCRAEGSTVLENMLETRKILNLSLREMGTRQTLSKNQSLT